MSPIACGCKGKGKGKTQSYKVKLPGGLTVTKKSESEATEYAAKHPGATVVKTA